MKVNGSMVFAMEWENKGGQMAHSTKVSGNWAKLMVTANFTMLMEIFTRETGQTTKQMGKELTLTPTELSMLGSGKTTNSMDMDLKHGLMVPYTKVNTQKERNTVLEN